MSAEANAPAVFPPASPVRISPLYDPRVRAVAFQAALVIVFVAVVGWFVSNTIANLNSRNISSGFGFLSARAGFAVGDTWLEATPEMTFGWAYLVGLVNTLRIAVVGVIFATLLGFLIGIMRLSTNWLVARVGTVYVETIRNVPLLLWLLFLYKAVLSVLPVPRNALQLPLGANLSNRGLILPWISAGTAVPVALLIGLVAAFFVARWATRRRVLTGATFPTAAVNIALIVGLPLAVYLASGAAITVEVPELRGFNFIGGVQVRPEFLALLVGLTVYTAAFIAEIVRAGILAVSRGQSEAAYALGLRPGRTLRLVVIPQAMRVIIPPLTSQYLNLTKNSSLAIAVGYSDLFAIYSKSVLNITGQAIEAIGMIMATYLTLSLAISLVMNWINVRMATVER